MPAPTCQLASCSTELGTEASILIGEERRIVEFVKIERQFIVLDLHFAGVKWGVVTRSIKSLLGWPTKSPTHFRRETSFPDIGSHICDQITNPLCYASHIPVHTSKHL